MVTISANTPVSDGTAHTGSFCLDLVRCLEHELRGSVHTIAGFAGLLEQGPLTEDQRLAVEWIDRASGTMAVLLEAVSRVVRAASNPCLDLEEVDPLDVIHEVCRRTTPLADELDVTLIAAVECADAVLGDREAMVEILEQLVRNGLQHSGAGRVVLRVAASGPGAVRFSVEDPGRGMGELELGRVFDPFVRFGEPGRGSGAGLGLTICRLLVEALGSKLLASSRIDAGTHLWFDLPARP